jgi:hypothetical protein
MMVQSSKETLVGSCNIDLQKKPLPVSTQLWPEVRNILREANQLMLPFLQLMGVTSSQLSPFCKVFSTLTELKEVYVMYCPKTFTYDDAVGKEDKKEVEPEVDDSGEQTKGQHMWQLKQKSLLMRLLMMLMAMMLIRAIWRMMRMMMVV